jgi:hypothetical protein
MNGDAEMEIQRKDMTEQDDHAGTERMRTERCMRI